MLDELKSRLSQNERITFRVKIIPKSKKNEVIGILDLYGEKTLKIKIASVPTKNQANEELIRYLSELMEVPQKNIHIKSGALSPLKIIEIQP